jgi:hypothetical protein
LIYEICEEIPTSAPTFEPNECEMINPGELYIFFMNSDNPDNLAIFVFVNLPEGLELYLTDDAWTGSEFQTQEGAYKVRTVIVVCYCCCCCILLLLYCIALYCIIYLSSIPLKYADISHACTFLDFLLY